jgi:hypothetical protein
MNNLDRVSVLREAAYRRFLIGYGLSFVFYLVTLLSVGWWMLETTGSATRVGIAYFFDYFPPILVTSLAAIDKVAEAVEVVDDEWARVATLWIMAEELVTTKTYLVGSDPLRFDGIGPIANIVVGMRMENPSIDQALTRNDNTEAVTFEGIKRVQSVPGERAALRRFLQTGWAEPGQMKKLELGQARNA